MDEKWKQLLGSFLMGVLMPAMMIRQPATTVETPQVTTQGTVPVIQVTQHPTVTAPAQVQWIPVLMDGKRLTMMDLEDYIVGVVLGEMPADFEMEALKAQAVVARTYALRCYRHTTKHLGGSICTDSACCQAYWEPEEYLADGGTLEAVERVREAVASTSGQVVTYDGELIEATYFACSGGRTEDALAVWGKDVPYLQSVDSPGEEAASCFLQTAVFTPRNFQNLLGMQLSGRPEDWVDSVVYTEGGGVASMAIGGRVFSGVELRQMLGLNSTAFFISADEKEVRVTVLGNGHRVGMSQYGADAMAASGKTYFQILSHYYPGTRIDKLKALG